MSISVDGQSRVPPGFRFHPTEEELLNYYLRKKVGCEKIDLDVIREVDLNKLEPWEIQEKCRIGSTPQNDWYCFSHKDKKYPTGTRTNRATAAGFWKATGRDKVICTSLGRIGMRKTLVFYKGRAPHGLKFDWIMHEYRLLDDHHTGDSTATSQTNMCNYDGEPTGQEDGWVVCRLFKKKNAGCDGKTATYQTMLQCMGRSYKKESINQRINSNNIALENSCLTPVGAGGHALAVNIEYSSSSNNNNSDVHHHHHQQDWATLDRFVASHLNGQSSDEWKQLTCFDDGDGDGDGDGNMTSAGTEAFICGTSSTIATANSSYRWISDAPLNYYNNNGSDVDLWGAFTASALSSGSNHRCHTSE